MGSICGRDATVTARRRVFKSSGETTTRRRISRISLPTFGVEPRQPDIGRQPRRAPDGGPLHDHGGPALSFSP